MNDDRFDATAVIHAHLIRADATTTDVAVELGYSTSDPYAIHATFTGCDSTSTWLLSRDVFGRGLASTHEAPAEEADVRMWRDEDPQYLLVTLAGSLGTALLAAPAGPVEQFLDETHLLVPAGTETARVDAAFEAFVTSILTT